ncbi:MAG: acetate--CoA ligase family protein [Candidatus Heimdallarchaeota archaeon]|nr:acetate--CoA ligase family protein [Candidatus Heimdallarchaeota archaeon]MCK5299160.1 acetate--CoA ligase family protein [Candidatus Heimdallarchaeota archaeon]
MSKKVKEIIATARKENRTFLLEPESKQLMKEIGIITTDFQVAKNSKEAIKVANEIGFPIVMKILSPQIIHKTDAGGVKLNINSEKDTEKAFKEILASAKKYDSKAEIRGVLIEKMVKPSTEIIIGVTRDPTFGPAIMFGLGGIFVELLKDVSFRIAPIKAEDAREMIHEIKALPMLQGFRGGPNVKLELIVDVLMKISQLTIDYIDDILEIDLNPIFAYEDKILTVDARIILTK